MYEKNNLNRKHDRFELGAVSTDLTPKEHIFFKLSKKTQIDITSK